MICLELRGITGVLLCAFVSDNNSEQVIAATVIQQQQGNQRLDHSEVKFWNPHQANKLDQLMLAKDGEI